MDKTERKQSCIVTLIDPAYYSFSKIFQHCAKNAYPEHDCLVIARGKEPPSGTIPMKGDGYPENPFATAILRYLIEPEGIREYENVFITDVDVIIRKEAIDIFTQHLTDMEKKKLICYDNVDHEDHMPGTHFVTKNWWGITYEARNKILDELKTGAIKLEKGMDEAILRRIVDDSDLPMNKSPILWNIHGIHLGEYRNGMANKTLNRPNEFIWMDKMICIDKEFMDMVAEAVKDKEFNRCWENLFKIYKLRKAQ